MASIMASGSGNSPSSFTRSTCVIIRVGFNCIIVGLSNTPRPMYKTKFTIPTCIIDNPNAIKAKLHKLLSNPLLNLMGHSPPYNDLHTEQITKVVVDGMTRPHAVVALSADNTRDTQNGSSNSLSKYVAEVCRDIFEFDEVIDLNNKTGGSALAIYALNRPVYTGVIVEISRNMVSAIAVVDGRLCFFRGSVASEISKFEGEFGVCNCSKNNNGNDNRNANDIGNNNNDDNNNSNLKSVIVDSVLSLVTKKCPIDDRTELKNNVIVCSSILEMESNERCGGCCSKALESMKVEVGAGLGVGVVKGLKTGKKIEGGGISYIGLCVLGSLIANKCSINT
ncbi:hypothetical protein ScalyP_jg2028 [Parmales sp. scaly parma]|nr:hypothetical protein ScalyP_jg2028 [Parmales sp. scaly parma]